MMVLNSLAVALAAFQSSIVRSDQTFVQAEMLGQYFAVDGTVNGKKARFIVDTGAGMCCLTPQAAKKFGVPEGQPVTANGAGEKAVQARITAAESFGIGGKTVERIALVVIDLPPVLQVDGLVGYTFLQKFAVTLDYQRPGLTLLPSGAFIPPKGSTTLEMKVRGNIPTFPGSLDGIAGWFSLDSGANGSLTVMAPFVADNKLNDKHPIRVKRIVGKGVGGYVFGESVRLDSVKFGDIRLPSMPASFTTNKSGAFANKDLIGNVGGELLRRFQTTIDYPAGKITFVMGPAFSEPFNPDRSGMFVDYVDSMAKVVDLVPNGPAQSAGIKVGDIIASIDGKPVSEIHPLKAGLLFRAAAGAKVRVSVRRGSDSVECIIELRDLV